MKAITRILLVFLFAISLASYGQWDVRQSVLHEGTWYKIGVVEDGVYEIDATWLQTQGIAISQVDPARIRLYGNVKGPLPEANREERFDDLTEIAIQVTGAADGSFDAQDKIRFYGQGPVTMKEGLMSTFHYERHPYTDTIYYFLRLDGEEAGLRIAERPSSISDNAAVIDIFPDYWVHESDELSPYSSGRVWYGDMITMQDGFKEFHFDMPYYVKDRSVRITSKVLGRCVSGFSYALSLNGVCLVSNDTIKAIQTNVFGREKSIDRMLRLDKDGFSVRYTINPSDQLPLLYIDYFVVNYWRELVFQEHDMAFRIISSQFSDELAEVQIRGARAGLSCWEVTDPMHPVVQQLQVASGIGTFGAEGAVEHDYHLFEPTGVKQVASVAHIPNQNLHALTNATYVIVTHDLFRAQAEALAEFHREMDGMDCMVVDVREIYNEFGTGVADPTAVRDFIRMIYQRSNGQLKYVLMFGKGTHDYRDIKGQGKNFVPTYETADAAWSQVLSMCTDDYFALMDVAEGDACNGKVDLGVGRFPVTTPEEAENMVLKAKHYADRSVTHGAWLNDHLLMADNDARSYVDNTESLAAMLDTVFPLVTQKKLYADSYPVVSTPSGNRIPGAHDELLECFEKGFGVLSYTGHGGVSGLMMEQVLGNSDILALRNYDRLPFVHTATCEFSEYDDPLLVSAGELMILNPQGGAIAMLTTTRPTYIGANQSMAKSFHGQVYAMDQGEMLRFGDIVRRTKANPNYYSKDNLCYVLFGDPALRFAYPSRQVSTLKINDLNVQNITIPASGLVTLEGCVAGLEERTDTLFNGVVEVKVYDKKTRFTTLGTYVQPKSYKYHHDVLFEGKAEVRNGLFTVTFPVPAEINHEEGFARVSYYAYDSIRGVTASGVCDRLQITGEDPTLINDHQGPEVAFYWDTPAFVSGDVVSRTGSLCADLFDEQGIYHYNYSIGRNIVLRSDVHEFENVVLNDRYEPEVGDYRRGRIVLPVSELDNGTHEFSLKVWDTQGNATEKTIVLVVEDGVMLAQVYNYPNPFSEGTYFTFQHGDMSEALKVWVEVYDLLGRKVAGLTTSTNSTAGTVPPIFWDGCDFGGNRLKHGVYVYRLRIEDERGHQRAVSGRMVVR